MQAETSVVLPVRNGARYLAEALRSVVDQTRPADEILVVDGGSTDGSVEIARSFAGVEVMAQRGEALADAFNTGIAAAHGRLIAFMSCDDRWTADKLEVQRRAFSEIPGLGYAWGKILCFQTPGQDLPPGARREWMERILPARIMETLMARRDLLWEVGGLRPAFSPSCDVDLFLRLADGAMPGLCVDRLILHKRLHDRQTTVTDLGRIHRGLLGGVREAIARRRAAR